MEQVYIVEEIDDDGHCPHSVFEFFTKLEDAVKCVKERWYYDRWIKLHLVTLNETHQTIWEVDESSYHNFIYDESEDLDFEDFEENKDLFLASHPIPTNYQDVNYTCDKFYFCDPCNRYLSLETCPHCNRKAYDITDGEYLFYEDNSDSDSD